MNLKKPPTTQVEFRYLGEFSSTSRSVRVPAYAITSPALPQEIWKGFKLELCCKLGVWQALQASRSLVTSHDDSSPCHLAAQCFCFDSAPSFCLSLSRPSLVFPAVLFSMIDKPLAPPYCVLTLTECGPLLRTPSPLRSLTWRLLLSHTLSHGGSPSVFPDKIHLVPSIKNLYFFCCSRTGYCAFIPLPAVVLIIQTLILWYLEQLWPVSCPYISAIIVTIGGGHPSQGTSHLKIFFKNYPDYLGQIPNFLISYSLLTLQLLCVNFSAFISPFSASVCPTAVSPFPISSLDLLVDLWVALPCTCLSVYSLPSVPALLSVGATTNSVTCQSFYWSFFILWQLH